MYWFMIVLFFSFHFAIPVTSNVDCLISSDTILLDQDRITEEKLAFHYERVEDKRIVTAKLCYLVLTIFFNYVRVEFLGNVRKFVPYEIDEVSLTIITSINYTRSGHIQTYIIYACDDALLDSIEYCNEKFYFQLTSGELFGIFKANHTKLQHSLQSILYKKEDEASQMIECFEENKMDKSLCVKDICSARQSLTRQFNYTKFTCGMPTFYEDIDDFVHLNIETKLCSNENRYSEFSYTCNINQCNDQKTIDTVHETILEYYNLSNFQILESLYRSNLKSNYCEVITKNTNQTTTISHTLQTTTISTNTKQITATNNIQGITTTTGTTRISSEIYYTSIKTTIMTTQSIPTTHPVSEVFTTSKTIVNTTPITHPVSEVFITSNNMISTYDTSYSNVNLASRLLDNHLIWLLLLYAFFRHTFGWMN